MGLKVATFDEFLQEKGRIMEKWQFRIDRHPGEKERLVVERDAEIAELLSVFENSEKRYFAAMDHAKLFTRPQHKMITYAK